MSNKKEFEKETDENLLFLFANSKNREALEVLFERHMASAYHIAYKYMHNQADAEDVVQKAFINVMRFADSQNQPGMVKAWIMKTVINTSKNEIKHLIRQRKLLQDKPIPQSSENNSTDEDTSELRKVLVSAIEKLPDQFRWPIWLTHYENMTVKEVSHALGKSENTIRTQISRGLEKLEQSLKGNGSKISSMNIIALLAECKKFEIVPTTLHIKIKSISNLKDSARLFATAPNKSNSFFLYAASSLGIILISLGGYFWWNLNRTEKINSNEFANVTPIIKEVKAKIKAIEPVEELNLSWDFNSKDLPQWCSIQTGNTKLINANDSHGQYLKILDKNDFVMKLDIPIQNKPFKVSYDLKLEPIGRETFVMNSLSEINKRKGVTFAFSPDIKENVWTHVEIIVQKNIQALYYNDNLMMVIVSVSDYDSSHFIHLEGTISNIDNIKVNRLEENKLKDFSKCIELSHEYLAMDGFHEIMTSSPIPEIKKEKIRVYWGYSR